MYPLEHGVAKMSNFTVINDTVLVVGNSSKDDSGDCNGDCPNRGDLNWVLWTSLAVSLFCIISMVTYYVTQIWIRRRGYMELQTRRQQISAFTPLLEEMRGRPRRVAPDESLTASERHFLIHDFADYP